MIPESTVYSCFHNVKKKQNGGYQTACPFCEANDPKGHHFYISPGHTQDTLMNCSKCRKGYLDVIEAGILKDEMNGTTVDNNLNRKTCTLDEALKAVMNGHKFERQHIYRLADGTEFGRHLAYSSIIAGEKKKIMPWVQPTDSTHSLYYWGLEGEPPLYNLPALLKDTASTVIISEGEKDVDTLTKAGRLATSLPSGAKTSWRKDFDILKGRDVIVITDNDSDGETYGKTIKENLPTAIIIHAKDIYAQVKEKGDITDIIEEIGLDEALQKLDAVILNKRAEQSFNQSSESNESSSISSIIKNYDDIEIKETDYLFFPWFPRGKLTLIQGDSGSSKSTFLYAVGANVSNGRPLLGVPCENPGNVLFVTLEDDESAIKTAFIDSGGNCSKLLRMDRDAIAKLDLSEEGAMTISNVIKEHDVKFLVLDPLQAYLRGDMNKANDTRPQLARLMDIAEQNNTTIVFIEHMGKDTTKGALHRGIGSVDIGAATRSMIQVVTDPEDKNYKIAFTVKNNTADIRDVSKAIRYRVADHPGSYDSKTGKHHHFHGHAEFDEIIPEYTELSYKKAVRKHEADEDQALQMSIDYESDPLVNVARKLLAQNPNGLFITGDDLIMRMTEYCGHCPYEQTKSKVNGLNHRIVSIRSIMMERDAIQMDIQGNAIAPKPYNWNGSIYIPESQKPTRGIHIRAIKNGSDGSCQTEM